MIDLLTKLNNQLSEQLERSSTSKEANTSKNENQIFNNSEDTRKFDPKEQDNEKGTASKFGLNANPELSQPENRLLVNTALAKKRGSAVPPKPKKHLSQMTNGLSAINQNGGKEKLDQKLRNLKSFSEKNKESMPVKDKIRMFEQSQQAYGRS
ncbi:MAG: hypothetical protein IC227_00325 [Enterococcus lacertideformus]|uniref:Uncharacterized protein n=1 Tax=Enterococcus lacertideformus TaxID=2771493 RepID=A0A931AWT3_9ENTE|nr:hypothetical protein [Enterococcus lacertideformus]